MKSNKQSTNTARTETETTNCTPQNSMKLLNLKVRTVTQWLSGHEANPAPSSVMPSLAAAALTPYVDTTFPKRLINLTVSQKLPTYPKDSKVVIQLEGRLKGVSVWGEFPKATFATVLIISPLSRQTKIKNKHMIFGSNSWFAILNWFGSYLVQIVLQGLATCQSTDDVILSRQMFVWK